MATTEEPRPMKILMLHGFTQTASLFRAKTRALEKHLRKALAHTGSSKSNNQSTSPAVQLVYLNGPHKLSASDAAITPNRLSELQAGGAEEEEEEARAWWRRKDIPTSDGQNTIVYEGLEEGLATIAQCVREQGPFDGVIGFSQGACAVGMVASLLEGRTRQQAMDQLHDGFMYPESFTSRDGGFVQPPLKFAIAYSGFRAPGSRHRGFYEPKITTPVLHVLGQLDTVVDEGRARTLVDACEPGPRGERVVMHPGGHIVPSQRPWLDAVAGFILECMAGGEQRRKTDDEVSAADMDVPF